MEDMRAARLEAWAREQLAGSGINPPARAELLPVSTDAGFRRYFRFSEGAAGRIFVDAPPQQENNEAYTLIARVLGNSGLNCPAVFAVDYENGFLVVSDLGDDRYLDVITRQPDRRDQLYRNALAAMARMQAIRCELPAYDAGLLREEMSLFEDWFLTGLLELEVKPDEREGFERVKSLLVSSAMSQPRAFVHRDYHSRNLMVTDRNTPGILDFQDAVLGPITYDLVSLYKDCYYRFERTTVTAAVFEYLRLLRGALGDVSEERFLRWFDLMGVQRHLKCAGIFSRLRLRDGKSGYLGDIPLVISYLIEACDMYDELSVLGEFLKARVRPLISRFARPRGCQA